MIVINQKAINKAVFLDRDGVIVIPIFKEGRSFAVRNIKDFQIYDTAIEALNLLKKNNFLIIIVTNQPDLNEGYISWETMKQMNKILLNYLPINSIKICPHKKTENCDCRKPKPGLLLTAHDEFNINFQKSYMVGDRKSDILAGLSTGCKTIFIDHHYESEKKVTCANYKCNNILEATQWIINN